MQIKSRLSQQLDKRIAAASSPVQAGCVRAERAVLDIRHGHLAQAREELTTLHQLAFQHPHPQLGAWLHFAEGLMSYFTDFSSGAADKIQRAQAIAKTAGLRELEALTSAWLAHLAYVRHDVAALAVHARHGLDVAGPEHHGGRARIGIALALAHHFAGRLESAQAWYDEARKHAMAEGDNATQSALIYNRAEMSTAQVRRESLAHPTRPVPELLLGADSVSHYDAAVGGMVMAELTPVLRAQILVVQGDYAQACALFEQHLPQAMSRGLARLGGSLLADLAWCRANLGQREQALEQAREAEIELDPSCDVDDRAVAHARLAQTYEALGEPEAARRHADSAAADWMELERQQQDWARQLESAGLSRP